MKYFAWMFRAILNNGICVGFSMLGFSLYFRNRRKVVFGKMRNMVAFRPMWLFGIRTAHSSLSHAYHLTNSMYHPAQITQHETSELEIGFNARKWRKKHNLVYTMENL